jgi:hypothetical protein
MRNLLLLMQLLVFSTAHADFDTLKLSGQWEWVQTNGGGFTHPEYSPESEGITRRVNIISKTGDDSIHFEATFYKNDTLTDSSVSIDSFFVLVFAWIAPREVENNEVFLSFYGDTLFRTSFNVSESPSHMYRRINTTEVRSNAGERDSQALKHPAATIHLAAPSEPCGMLFNLAGRRLLPMQYKMNPISNTPRLLIHLRERKSQNE